MSWKERIENNFTLFVLGLLALGFGAGFGAYKGLAEMSGAKSTGGESTCPQVAWNEAARKADWIPRNQCPAYPVTVSIVAPGSGSTIEVSGSSTPLAYMDIVVHASRPIPKNSSVGLIFNQDKSSDFFLRFPVFTTDESRTVFREANYFLPFRPDPNSTLNMWAVVVDNRMKFGSQYSNLDQIRASDADVVMSPKNSVIVHIK